MTYLDWGCTPLADECRSCLDAICSACSEQQKEHARDRTDPPGFEAVSCTDDKEPDCDHCDLETKPDCVHCEVILSVCRGCSGHASCEYRITG